MASFETSRVVKIGERMSSSNSNDEHEAVAKQIKEIIFCVKVRLKLLFGKTLIYSPPELQLEQGRIDVEM